MALAGADAGAAGAYAQGRDAQADTKPAGAAGFLVVAGVLQAGDVQLAADPGGHAVAGDCGAFDVGVAARVDQHFACGDGAVGVGHVLACAIAAGLVGAGVERDAWGRAHENQHCREGDPERARWF